MNSTDDVDENLRRAAGLLAIAADGGAKLAVLPEFFALMSADENRKLTIAEEDNDGPIQNFLAESARRHNLYLVGGTVPLSASGDKVFSACPLYAPNGERVARYDKMHLFRFGGDDRSYDETKTMLPGDAVVTADTPLGKIGLSVCYDLRFPELYRRMNAPDILVAPSAFTPETGQAHWELLLRARAVENMAHMLGAAQCGEHPGGRKTHGETMLIGPWGDIKARAKICGDECVLALIDPAERREWRRRLPALDNRRLA